MEEVKKKKKISGRKVVLIGLSCVLLCIIIAVAVLFGPGLFAKTIDKVEAPSTTTTMRKEAPTDGTLPTEVTNPLDNIAYLAYVLDHQPYYNNYAYNSTTAMGYEQITRSWKDYKGAELTGIGKGVMVSSDLTHSLLVKSATQSCFVGGTDAYLRTGNKPASDTLPTEIKWSEDVKRYTHDDYLTAYGEFSTELTVYVINEETASFVSAVTDNGDGTYSQSVSLTPQAACWYQYGMKTRGSLKGFPAYNSIEITFTYDAKWQVLETYCEEEATIAPSALGGAPKDSSSRTTTTFTYGAEAIDENHFAYFENYYKSRLEISTDNGGTEVAEPEMLDVLGSGFRKVVDGSGQQFALGLGLGNTDYDGKLYLSLGDLSNVLGTLDVRFALEKQGSGKQDLYVEFASGRINAYYGDGFAMTAGLTETALSVTRLSNKIKQLSASGQPVSVYSLLADGADSDPEFDFNSVLENFVFELTETSATITIKSDDLFGLGVGVDAVMNFTRTIDEEGISVFDFADLQLNSLTVGGEPVELNAQLIPDETPVIERQSQQTPANLADYINGVYHILNCNTVKVDLTLQEKLVEGLSANLSAFVRLTDGLAARVDAEIAYKGLTAKFSAYYAYDENYGKVYLNLTELNGQKVNAKVYCSVDEVIETVEKLLGYFGKSFELETENKAETVASIVNKALNLDFGKIIGKLDGNKEQIGVTVNVDELLNAFDYNLGFAIGEVELTLNNGDKLTVNGSLPELGLEVSICGSDVTATLPEDTQNYVDILDYLSSVFALLNSKTFEVNLQLDGIVEGLKVEATVLVPMGERLSAKAEITVEYNGLTAKLNAYYLYDQAYGKAYINLTELNGQPLDAKIYCDIKDTATAVQELLGLQTPSVEMPEITVAKVVEVILNLDFNKLIKVDNSTLKVTVNADEVLSDLGIDLGLTLGEVQLVYTKATSTLNASVPEFGASIAVSGSEEEVAEPADKQNYVDILDFVNNIASLVLSGKYHLEAAVDYKGVAVNLNAEVEFKGENKNILAVQLNNVTATYENITLGFNAYYEIDLTSDTYGIVYLQITKLNEQALNAKVYCDIKDIVTAVQQIILEGSEEITVAKVVEVILNLDFNKLIKVDNSTLKVTVNADEVLNGLGIDLGLTLGEVLLEYVKETSTLNATLPEFGATIAVSGSEEEVASPADKQNYVDILDYVNNITKLVLSGKYHLEAAVDYKGVDVNLNAEVEFKGENKNILAVQLNNVTATYENITLGFNAYYEIDLTSDTYGIVYLHITKLNEQDLNAKVYCDIKDIVTAVQQITLEGSEEITVAKVVELILNLDFNKLIKVDNSTLKVTVNVDEVLSDLGIDLGLTLGEVLLEYVKETSTLNATLPEFGATIAVSGSEEEVTEPADKQNYVDILDYVNNITKLVLSGKYHLEAAVDYKGVAVNLNAEVEFKGENKNILAVQLNNVTATYENITLGFNAYYEIDLTSDTYGIVYLQITKLNEQALNAKVYCDIKDIVTAVQQITLEGSEGITVAKVVEVILNLDFNKLIKVDNSTLKVTVNADEVLSDLGIDLGLTIGEVELVYTKATSTLNASIPEFGANIAVSGSEATVEAPEDKQNYLNVNELLTLIENAIEKVNEIVSAQDAAFTVNAAYAKDGVTVNIEGDGEVIWVKDDLKVALSLKITVTENGNSQSFALNFVYDRAVMNDENSDKPFVIITLNDTGLKVYRTETDNLTDTIGGLISAIERLTAKDIDSNADNLVAPAAVGYSANELPELNDILYNENVNKVLSALLSFASDLTVKLENADGENVKQLLVSYAKGGSLTLGADGCLNLNLTVKELNISASVEAGNGQTVSALLENFEDGYTFYEDINAYAEYLFDRVLNSLDNLTLKDVLDTDSYVADFLLDGNLSGIKALENVYIKAELYYSEDIGDERLGNNLIQTDFHFSINGTDAEANLSYSGRNIYVCLSQVGSMKFSDLKFKVSADELYTALEEVVRIVTDTNLIDMLTGSLPAEEQQPAVQTLADDNSSLLTDLLYALLNMDLEKSFAFDRVNGTAEINIDDILETVAGVKIGTVKVSADIKNHTAGLSITNGENSWLTVDANPAGSEVKDKNKINPDDYVNVNFISTLLADLRKTVTDDNGKIYKTYTYTGTITANVIVAGDIKLNNATLTLGFDKDGEFYLSLAASLDRKTVMGIEAWKAADISITYSHGLITMGRNMNTAGEEYKIMTVEYLLDNLFNKQSPICWLVGMSASLWESIMNMAVKDVNVNSGLTTPQTYSLFERQQIEAEKRINIAYFVNGLKVLVNGQSVSEYGNSASGALGKFGNMDGNFYAVDLKADELTGGVLTELYAAVVRNDEQGISGIKAYGAIQKYVTFTLDLNTYREGVTETYGGKKLTALQSAPTEEEFYEGSYYDADGKLMEEYDQGAEFYVYADSTASLGTVAAPNYYAYVKDTYGFDKDHEFEEVAGSHYNRVFGCYHVGATVKEDYTSSNVLEIIYLDIYDENGELERTLEIRYGSTVNLVSSFPELAADGRKLIYVDTNGEKLPSTVVIKDGGVLAIVDGRVSIFKSSEEAEEVIFDFAGIIKPVTAALAEDDGLAEYALNGYTFLGWYNDSEFSGEALNTAMEITNTEDGVKKVYGWFVKTEIIVNGVIYTFSADNGGSYIITGFDEIELKPYTLENSVLELENSFTVGAKTYKVTAIGERAFADANLKNVIVPANITNVGKLAFTNNYGIKSVVFLADSVYMQGGTLTGYTAFNTNVTNDSPFYNCGISDGSTTTLLNVYYNVVTCDSGKDWKQFLRIMTYVPAKATHYYIGSNGGSVNAGGTWAYVEYGLNAQGLTLSELGLANGLTCDLSNIDCAVLESRLSALLDGKTAAEYVNGYTVKVTSVKVDGKYKLEITVTENTAEDRYYKLTLNVAQDSAANALLDAEIIAYGESTYVKNGTVVTVRPAIDGFTVNAVASSENISPVADNDNLVFTMAGETAELTVSCVKKTISEVTIISESVAFTYEGSAAANRFVVTGVEEGVTQLSAPKAEGYHFVGWTYLEGETLVFTDSVVTYGTYYPVWAEAREEITEVGVIAAGNINDITVSTVENSVFYKWYTDKNFVNEATSLTTATTVLYSRMQFALKVNLTASNTEWYYTKYNGNGYTDMGWNWGSVTNGTLIGSNNCTFTADTLVTEGYTVEVSRYWSNAIYIQVRDNDNYIVSYLIKGKNTGRWQFEKWVTVADSASRYVEFDTAYWTVAEGLNSVDGTKYYNTSGNTQLLGTVNKTSNYVSLKVVGE